ncbi:MAG: LPXTG cell wall anchor domain-containing protein [Actinobacteria bacterium]|nr:LPXTG cell wall anchor domain-containing protein [Actinomycetota bacterium]
MTSISRKQRAAIVVGGAALATGIAAPAVAATYPPNPGQNSGGDTNTTSYSTGSSATPAYTGSNATTFGVVAGLAALGVGGGLLVASRRKKA